MKAIILEDERMASNRLNRLIIEVDPSIEIIKIFESIEDTAAFLSSSKTQPEILFADIQVADGNSFELFNIVKVKSKVIFTTAYDEYAIKAFRANAIDYLMKPIKKEELRVAIEKAKPIFNPPMSANVARSGFQERFLFRFGSKVHHLKVADLSYIFSRNKLSYFVTKDGKRSPSDKKLQELQGLLDPNLFFRANRQFIIHIDSIAEIKTHDASRLKILLDPAFDQEIIISTERTRKFKKWLQR